jgi:hypothetical protein
MGQGPWDRIECRHAKDIAEMGENDGDQKRLFIRNRGAIAD